MRIQIDRDLPVPVTTQIQGQIEYGVSNGDFPAGSRLPSVRELALELGVSPVTVSQVYKSLQAKGLIATVQGTGTFVRALTAEEAVRPGRSRVDELLRQALVAAEREGVSRTESLERFQHLVAQSRHVDPLRAVFVGVYADVTRAYAADLRRHLRPADSLSATTFDELDVAASARAAIEAADLVLTFAHRVSDLRRYVPPSVEVATVNLIPSERTRVALAEIDPLAQLVIISTVPEFLPTFRRAVARFASHVESVRAALHGTPEARVALERADVVVYGTGSETVLDGLPSHVRSFEYRHVPDPIHVERVLLPIVAHLRESRSRPARTQEAR
jgi:DNA-binding transcriptional regulator YhcF (GntR family)